MTAADGRATADGSAAPRGAGRPRLTSKGAVLLLAVLGAGTLLAGGSRTWVSGTVDDPVLGASRVAGSGTEVVPGLVALALAALAAVIATATSGRVARVVTLVIAALATCGLGGLVTRVLLDPSGVLGSVAAQSTGRTGSIETHASATGWAWAGVAAVAVLAAAVLAAGIGLRRWSGLSSRYEAPTAPRAGAPAGEGRGARGERVTSDWDRLSVGDDPTDDPTAARPADAPAEDRPPDEPTPGRPDR